MEQMEACSCVLDVSAVAEGDEKVNRKKYLQTSTPFIRPSRLPSHVTDHEVNNSLNIDTSCYMPQEMSLEASAIAEQPSQVILGSFSINTSSENDTDSSGVPPVRANNDTFSADPAITSRSSLNRGFYNETLLEVNSAILTADNSNTSGCLPASSSIAENNESSPQDSTKSDSRSCTGSVLSAEDPPVTEDTSIQALLNKSFTECDLTKDIAAVKAEMNLGDETCTSSNSQEANGLSEPVLSIEEASFVLNTATEGPRDLLQTEKPATELQPSTLSTIEGDQCDPNMDNTLSTIGVDLGSATGLGKSCSSTSVSSIYLDDGIEERVREKGDKKPADAPKRLTMAQRATQEALASFGGSGLGSVEVRRVDLRTRLRREVEEGGTGGRHCARRTRLQVAREEANSVFKGMALGEGVKRYGRNALPSFRKADPEPREKEGCSDGPQRQTRVQRARREVYESFSGASLDSLPVQKKRKLAALGPDEDGGPPSKAPCKRLTRVEQARLEALQSFGGSLGDVMEGARKRVARTLEGERGKEGEKRENKENHAAVECV